MKVTVITIVKSDVNYIKANAEDICMPVQVKVLIKWYRILYINHIKTTSVFAG